MLGRPGHGFVSHRPPGVRSSREFSTRRQAPGTTTGSGSLARGSATCNHHFPGHMGRRRWPRRINCHVVGAVSPSSASTSPTTWHLVSPSPSRPLVPPEKWHSGTHRPHPPARSALDSRGDDSLAQRVTSSTGSGDGSRWCGSGSCKTSYTPQDLRHVSFWSLSNYPHCPQGGVDSVFVSRCFPSRRRRVTDPSPDPPRVVRLRPHERQRWDSDAARPDACHPQRPQDLLLLRGLSLEVKDSKSVGARCGDNFLKAAPPAPR